MSFEPGKNSSTTDDTDGHGWEGASSWSGTSFAATRRVNTPGSAIPSLSVKSVVPTAVFGMTDCVLTWQGNGRMGFHMAPHVDFASLAPLCGHFGCCFWFKAEGPGVEAESSKQTGGRRESWARRPPDNGAGEDLHPGWGARLICGSLVKRARVAQVEARSGTSPGCTDPRHVFRWSFAPFPERPPATLWQPSGLASIPVGSVQAPD